MSSVALKGAFQNNPDYETLDLNIVTEIMQVGSE